MLNPAVVNIVSFFYPLGNTPAVCLTQDLPCEESARVLLLGCGDVRSILFTTYSDTGIGPPRPLDITCCDIVGTVHARNILLLTLLVDDVEGSNGRLIWNVYYHFFLDNESLELVQVQAKKLHALSASIQSWHGSKYGRFLRICDRETLAGLREIWNSYCVTDLSEDERASHTERFRAGIRRARDLKARVVGHGSVVLTGFRSAAPVSIHAFKDLPDLYQHFWDHGIMDGDRDSLSAAKHPNPMFASSSTDTSTLHYGTDPLLGFHLAAAYIPFVPGSPLHPEPRRPPHPHKVVEAARLQFRAWGVSFRQSARHSLVLRFFAGEALAFCHTLQHKKATGNGSSANRYREPYSLKPLTLDGEDYAAKGDAPLSFNVIDTSNLVDHLGALNLLVAASPLMDNTISAALYTESLVRREENYKGLIDGLLCGHFPTVSILLGLFPVEYWTNATAVSSFDERFIDIVKKDIVEKPTGQMHCRLTWKRPVSACAGAPQTMTLPPVHFDEPELAHVLYQVYLKMFEHEDLKLLMSKPNLLALQNWSHPCYHRGSLASFLRFVKNRVAADWDKVMHVFLNLVENDHKLLTGKNYIQELYLQLHIFDLYSVLSLSPSFNRVSDSQALKGLRVWKDIPPVVCITLKVPRGRLGVFTKLPPTELGTPLVHCTLQSSGASVGRAWKNIFAVVQLAFGRVTTSGSRSTDDFKVNITEDKYGWMGISPLFVSFYVPTWVVLLEPEAATIAFGVQSTPESTQRFLKVLGLEMNVYETKLAHEDNFYITKHLPNQSGYASVCSSASADVMAHGSSDKAILMTTTANVDLGTARIVAMTGRVTVLSEDVKSVLRNGGHVETIQISPCIIAVIIGNGSHRYRLHFPAPVLKSRGRTRIARKSSYVEVVAPLAGPTEEERFPNFMYPLFVNGRDPVIWNMPRLKLDCLPIFDKRKTADLRWLNPHTSLMFSTRERSLREKSMAGADVHKDVRLNFKDSLFSMFMRFSGLQGGQARIFGINNPTRGGVHVIVFASCLRLDMANHTIVLDSAVLPLNTWLVPHIGRFLSNLPDSGLCNIRVDDDELALWKQVIPAMVERCRQWKHRSSCEYIIKSEIPLSVEDGQPLLCSCGEGTLPAGFISGIPGWDSVSKYAVRAAISPSFSPPFVDQSFGGDRIMKESVDGCKTCGNEKSSGGASLLKCARCQDARYCSAECQRGDWKEHKKVCTK